MIKFALAIASMALLPSISHAQQLQPLAPLTPTPPLTTEPPLQPANIYSSIVRIEAATQVPNYREPWKAGSFSGGRGTGFLIGKNRFLTNAHVVSNARRLLITVHGSPRKHPARILYVAHDCDLALLEVLDFTPFQNLQHLAIGDVPKLESQVRVIGYPVGGNRISITRGVVSRIDFNSYSHSRVDQHLVVQIDAAINPGNSGGPLLDSAGRLIGVNTAIFSPSGAYAGIGFAVPVQEINRVIPQLIRNGRLIKPGIGASLADARLVKRLGIEGVLVLGVEPDGPAHKAGIRPTKQIGNEVILGDIITGIAGNKVRSYDDIRNEIERFEVGDQISINILRDGEPKELSLRLSVLSN